MKKLLVIATTLALSGCLGTLLTPSYTPEIKWQEEVKLHDGRVIVVERERRKGGRAEPGQAPPQNWEEIRAKHPDTGEEIVWQETTPATVYLLDFVKGEAYLAVRVGLFADCKKYGFPKSAFVFFRNENGKWERMEDRQFPPSLDTNLLLGAWHAEQVGMLASFMTIEKKAIYAAKHRYSSAPMREILLDKKHQNPCGDFSTTKEYIERDK